MFPRGGQLVTLIAITVLGWPGVAGARFYCDDWPTNRKCYDHAEVGVMLKMDPLPSPRPPNPAPECDAAALGRAIRMAAQDKHTRVVLEDNDTAVVRGTLEQQLPAGSELGTVLRQCDDTALTHAVNAFTAADDKVNPFGSGPATNPFPATETANPFPSGSGQGGGFGGLAKAPMQYSVARPMQSVGRDCNSLAEGQDYESSAIPIDAPGNCPGKIEIRVTNTKSQPIHCTAYVEYENGSTSVGSSNDVKPFEQNVFIGGWCHARLPPKGTVGCFAHEPGSFPTCSFSLPQQ